MRCFTCASALLFAALAACIGTSESDIALGGDGPPEIDGEIGGGGDNPLGSFEAFLGISAPDCDRASVFFEVVTRSVDGVPPAEIDCEIEFSDGSSASTCFGTHEFAAGGVYDARVTVRDRATGAQISFDQRFPVRAPIVLESTIEAPACGLSISVDTNLENTTETVTVISPRENVLGFDLESRSYLVSEPGTYTVEIIASDERTNGPICERTLTKTVEVVACDDHEHDETCVH